MNEDVNPLHDDGTPKSQEEIEQEIAERGGNSAPGSKTDPALLLESLREEREKRRILEEEKQDLEDRIALLESSNSSEFLSDEGKALKSELDETKKQIASLTQDLTKTSLLKQYPILEDKWEEFTSYQNDPENKGMPLKVAAKAFLVENGLIDTPRKGLEKPTGGQRVPVSQEMSVEEIKILRETNFEKYRDMLSKGLIKI